MSAKQEAEKWLSLPYDNNDLEVVIKSGDEIIKNLLKELEATERKLADAEKILIEIKDELSSMNYRGDLQDLILDYEASKGE